MRCRLYFFVTQEDLVFLRQTLESRDLYKIIETFLFVVSVVVCFSYAEVVFFIFAIRIIYVNIFRSLHFKYQNQYQVQILN